MSRGRIGTALGALLLACAWPARAQDGIPPQLREVGFDQNLGAQVPLDLVFRDEAGAEVELGRYFGDKPVVLALVYYECPMLCSMVLNGLTSSLRVLKFDIGSDFEVLTISFDPGETPELAAAKKRNYVEEYARPGAAAGWHFLTGGDESIRTLTEAVGFRYVYDPDLDQYAHASGIVVLTPEGRVARYFFGIEYAPKDLRLGLVEAAEGRIGSVVDQVLLYCFRYDPESGTYSAVALNIVRLGGILTVSGIVALILLLRRKGRPPRSSRRAS
ncbi:MAG: SCO family protein [Candidatus Krumholzibacteriia bacterium]